MVTAFSLVPYEHLSDNFCINERNVLSQALATKGLTCVLFSLKVTTEIQLGMLHVGTIFDVDRSDHYLAVRPWC